MEHHIAELGHTIMPNMREKNAIRRYSARTSFTAFLAFSGAVTPFYILFLV